MVDEFVIESLVKKVADQLESDPNNLDSAVAVADGFYHEKQIELQTLLELAIDAGSKGQYSFAYVIAKVASKAQDKTIASASHSIAGLALQSMGNFEDAEKEYQTALVINPKRFNTHYSYGTLLQQMNRLSDAEKEYQNLLVIDPKSA